MNYGELKTMIRDDYVHRSDLSDDQLNRMAELVQKRLTRDVTIREQVTDTTLTPTTNPFSGPSDLYEVIELSYATGQGGRVYLNPTGRELASKWDQADTSGSYWYVLTGTQIEVSPSAVDRELRLVYKATAQPLVNDSDQTDLLTQAPSLWLYGMLREVYFSLQDYESALAAADTYNTEVVEFMQSYGWNQTGDNTQMQGASTWQ